jgi:hypothetical protein
MWSAMIVNAYAVLDGFVSLLRLVSGLLVVALAAYGWRQWRAELAHAERQSLEDRFYLLFLLSFLLLGLNIVSWPLLYSLLQSYVPQWPGVMCIYGVTRIGTGSLGPSRFLPGLLDALQMSKPLLVFVSGACFVLYGINRHTTTSPLLGRILLGLLVLGIVDVVDAGTEITYLVIPKKEEFLSAGCCSVSAEGGTARLLPAALIEPENRSLLYAGYYGVNFAMVLLLLAGVRSAQPLAWRLLLPLLPAALLALAVNSVFLVEIVAPRLLNLPDHHCPYDLIAKAPESMAAVALFLGGIFCVGWVFVARCLGWSDETAPWLPHLGRALYGFGIFGFLFSLVLISTELALS